MIINCWSQEPNDRPDFSDIYFKLSCSQFDMDDNYRSYENLDGVKIAKYINEISTYVINNEPEN